MTDTNQNAAGAARAHACVPLDRTGSMGSIWNEALVSLNAYVEALTWLADGAVSFRNDKVTFAIFHYHVGLQFDVLRREVTAANWKKVSYAEASPRWGAPLFDAIGRIAGLAEADQPARAVIVVMTDGEENASKEVIRAGARAALARARAKRREMIFPGAGFGSLSDAEAAGIGGSRSIARSAGNFDVSMRKLASKSLQYFKAADPMDFNAENRKESGEEDVKRCKGS